MINITEIDFETGKHLGMRTIDVKDIEGVRFDGYSEGVNRTEITLTIYTDEDADQLIERIKEYEGINNSGSN